MYLVRKKRKSLYREVVLFNHAIYYLLCNILKRSRDFLLCTKKKTNRVLFNMVVTTELSPCSRSVPITFTVRVTKQHPVNISFLKTTAVHYRVTKCVLVRVHIIKSLGLEPSWFNSYPPELILIFYSVIKHGYRCFIS